MLTNVSQASSSQEALQLAGLDWQVATTPLRALGPDGSVIDVPGQNLIYREDTRQSLGVVGKKYKALSNVKIFEVADDIVRVTGGRFERVLSFGGGRRIALQVSLPGELTIGKDIVQRLLTIVDTRDGTTGTLVFDTPQRLACFNVLRVALSRAESKTSIRHTLSGEQRFEAAAHLVSTANEYFNEFKSVALALNGAPYTVKQMGSMVELLIPKKGEEPPTAQALRVQQRLVELFDAGLGHEATGIQGSAWAALNAVAEYVDHERGTRSSATDNQNEKRLESAYFGSGQIFKEQALTIIRNQVGL